MTGKLLSLNDSLARSIYSYLDIDGLGQVASTCKKCRALSTEVDSDAAKIQALVQKHRLRDLGLRVACGEKVKGAHLIDAGPQRWLFTCGFLKDKELTLSQNGLFTFHSPRLNELYINGSSHYLFTADANNLQVRDLQGNLLTSIPAPILANAFELPFRQNQQLILVVMRDKLEVWDITQKANPVTILTHPVASEIDIAQQFENVLVLSGWMKGPVIGAKTFFVYDMNDFQKPPQEVVHPRYPTFSFMMETCRNGSQLFLAPEQNVVSLVPRSGNFSWEIPEITRYTHFVSANEKWLVLFHIPPVITSYDQSKMAYIETRDAKTGAFCGKFFMPYELYVTKYDFTLWGNSILVAKKEDALHFWLLPEGRRLPSWKLENCKIKEVIVSGKQLVVHYEDRNSGQYRLISLNTPPSPEEASAPNDLPNLSIRHPAHKEPSLCDRIWACVSSIFDWIASLFKRFL